MKPFLFVASFVHIALFASILYYLHRMKVEKCECALTPTYNLLYRATATLLVLRVVTFLLELVFNARRTLSTNMKYIPYIFAYVLVLLLVHIIYFVVSIRYIHRLYRDACKCSDNSLRNVYYVYSILMAVVLSFIFFFLLSMWSLVSEMTKATSTNTNSKKK